jgi:hypothetical protein
MLQIDNDTFEDDIDDDGRETPTEVRPVSPMGDSGGSLDPDSDGSTNINQSEV